MSMTFHFHEVTVDQVLAVVVPTKSGVVLTALTAEPDGSTYWRLAWTETDGAHRSGSYGIEMAYDHNGDLMIDKGHTDVWDAQFDVVDLLKAAGITPMYTT